MAISWNNTGHGLQQSGKGLRILGDNDDAFIGMLGVPMTPGWRQANFSFRGEPALVACMAVVALGAGLSLAWGATYALIGVALVAVILWPSVGLAVAIVIESCKLVPIMMGVSSTNLSLMVTAALVVAAIARTARDPMKAGRVLIASGLLAATLGPGMLIGLAQSAPLHLFSTVNLLLAPFAAFAAARNSSEATNRWMLRVAILSLTANAAACAWQVSTGVGGLVADGLSYGSTVRQIDGILRTPGLTVTSATAGLFAASVLVWMVAGVRNKAARVGRMWTVVGIASGGAVLVLSTSRSGAILVVVTAFTVAFFWGRAPGEIGRSRKGALAGRLFIVLGVLAIPVALTQYGANSSDSLFDRVAVWERLLAGNISLFGIGAGSVGASSYSAYNPRGGVFVDNSWLSVLLQFGVAGVLATLVFLVIALLRLGKVSKVRLSDSGKAATLISVLIAISVTAFFVEVLDYVIVMMILGCILSQNRIRVTEVGDVAGAEAERRLSLRFAGI